jgi:hypothetical protein
MVGDPTRSNEDMSDSSSKVSHRSRKAEARRKIYDEHKHWGMLPPQKEGTGLMLMILAVIPWIVLGLVTVTIGYPDWSPLLSLASIAAIFASSRHTNAWLDAKAEETGLL